MSPLEKYDTLQNILLDSQDFVDVHIHFIRLTAPMIWGNDRWSDYLVGMVVTPRKHAVSDETIVLHTELELLFYPAVGAAIVSIYLCETLQNLDHNQPVRFLYNCANLWDHP